MNRALKTVFLAAMLVVMLVATLYTVSTINKKRNVGKGDEYQNPNVETVKIVVDE